MNKPAHPPADADALRRRAQIQLRQRRTGRAPAETKADMHRVVQELQIHQIELEMQNEELKQTKAEVDAGLEKFTDLYDFAPVGYFSLNEFGEIREVNLRGAALLGAERAHLTGRRIQLFLAPPDRPAFNSFLKQVFADQSKRAGEFGLLLPGQPLRVVNIRAERQPTGRACRTVMTDVTERKRAEETLRVSEIRYRRLFETAHDGVLILDSDTRRITDANPFMTRLLGYPTDQLVGKELFEIGLLKDKAASREMFQQLKRNLEVRYEDLPFERQDGRRQEVEVVANLYQENGRAVIQCNIRDITERKRAEEILRRSEVLFAAIVAQAPVGVYVVNARFQLQQISPRARAVFGQIQPLIGRDFSEILHLLWSKQVADEIEGHFRHTLQTGEPYQTPDFAARRRDLGLKEIYEWQLQRVLLHGGQYAVICFFKNITERQRVERAQRRLDMLAASNEKLRQEIVLRQAGQAALRQSERRTRQLLEQSQQQKRKLRGFAHRMLVAQEHQRKAISRELHDKICQLLVGINVHLAGFTKSAAVNPAGIKRTIAPLRRLVEESVRTVHQFARELRPATLDDLGLIPALRSYLGDFPRRKGREIEFTAFAGVEALDKDKQMVLYRVVQEALTNVDKHAQARLVKVTILKARGGVCLEIADDGKAFDVARLLSPRWNKRLGLVGMRERVDMVGGRFSLMSVPGTGTTVRAEIPFRKKKSVD